MRTLSRSFPSPLPWNHCPKCRRIHNPPKEDVIEKEDPGWAEYGSPCGSFVMNTSCKNCSTVIETAGLWSLEPREYIDMDGELVFNHEEIYHVRYCNPAPKLITVPAKASKLIKDSLGEAFEAYWLSNELAAGCIRKVMEYLCDALHIQKNKLHKRLLFVCSDRFQNGAFSHLEDVAIAAKWLGNAGAHEINSVDGASINFLFEALETFMGRLYEGNTLNERAQEIRQRFETATRGSD